MDSRARDKGWVRGTVALGAMIYWVQDPLSLHIMNEGGGRHLASLSWVLDLSQHCGQLLYHTITGNSHETQALPNSS